MAAISEAKQLEISRCAQEHPEWGGDRIAKVCGVSKDVARKYRGSPKAATPEVTRQAPTETDEISGNERTICLPKTRIDSLEKLIAHCKIDRKIWFVDRWICNKWELGAKDDQGKLNVAPLFQVKAYLKKNVAVVDARAELEELKALAKKISYSPFTYKKGKASTGGHMLEINIPDPHFGKLAWGEETGGANYDTKIAESVFMRAFEALLERTKAYVFDEIWFVVGNDLLNSDTKEGQTTGGTPVTNDTRYCKTFRVVRTCIVRCIERLRTIAKVKVKVIMVSGNHDSMSVYHLGDSLECYFHDKKDVEIDNSPKKFKFHRYGRVMLMFTHGDKGKKANYPLLMATQEPEMFGATEFREAHVGHWHGTEVAENHGVRVRTLPALCPADDWHAENGLVGNKRSAEAFAWNAVEGMVGTAMYSVTEQQ